MGNFAYSRKSKQSKFSVWLERVEVATEGEEGKVSILDSSSVIYDFQEEEKVFLSFFVNFLIIFCSPSPPKKLAIPS